MKRIMKRIKQRIETLMKRIEQGIEAVEEWFAIVLLPFLIILLFVLATIFLFVMFGDGAVWIDLLGRKDKGGVLEFIGIAMGGILLAIQGTVSYRRAKAVEDTAQAQAQANENTEEGQRQERFKNAIEHLGHERSSVRLGGAYELSHLAEDIEELRQTVLEILCAHIRQTTRNEAYQKEYGKKPSEEIQSLLTLLFMQDHKMFDGYHINLQGSCLNGAYLPQARLQKADLVGAQLQGAELLNAQLQGAIFQETQLQGARLWYAQLQGAHLLEAHLQGAKLLGAQLQGAELSEAQLQGAKLLGAQLQGANFRETQLQGAILRKAQLQGIVSSYDESQRYLFLDFVKRIRYQIDQESDFSTVVFSGGLSEDEVNDMTKEMPDSESADDLKEKLKPHIGQPASHELPADSGAETGSYTEEDAEQWIKEYEEAFNRDDVHS